MGMPPLKNMLKISSGSKSSNALPPPAEYGLGAPAVRSSPSLSYAARFCGLLRHENARDTAARHRQAGDVSESARDSAATWKSNGRRLPQRRGSQHSQSHKAPF